LRDLRDGVFLEIVAELGAAHHGLLASKLAKKASTIHGAIVRLRRGPSDGDLGVMLSPTLWST
ncbi:hypothetical protein, partial [Salipiger abyssi]|uniref:hypothetical protein n=1 Tax=Salipiger abyssi TaxID=1250539 RepID=UPI001A8E63EE